MTETVILDWKKFNENFSLKELRESLSDYTKVIAQICLAFVFGNFMSEYLLFVYNTSPTLEYVSNLKEACSVIIALGFLIAISRRKDTILIFLMQGLVLSLAFSLPEIMLITGLFTQWLIVFFLISKSFHRLMETYSNLSPSFSVKTIVYTICGLVFFVAGVGLILTVSKLSGL